MNETAQEHTENTNEREPLSRRVVDHIRQRIVLDEWYPGHRLTERSLAEELDVSRTPLREALKILETEGLVKLLPNRGAIVAAVSASEAHDKLEVLSALERLAGELACVYGSDEDIRKVCSLHHEMLAAYTREDRKQYFIINQKIHELIVAMSGNKALVETHRRINVQLYRVRYLSNMQSRKWHTAIEEHEEILKALVARDGEALSRIMRNHLTATWTKFSEVLEDPRIRHRIEQDDNGDPNRIEQDDNSDPTTSEPALIRVVRNDNER